MAALATVAGLLLAVLVPLWMSSQQLDKATIQQSDVQEVAEQWASGAGWSVVGVTTTGDQVLVDATGPKPAPDLAILRRDLDAAGRAGLDVRVSLGAKRYTRIPSHGDYLATAQPAGDRHNTFIGAMPAGSRATTMAIKARWHTRQREVAISHG